MMNNLKPQRAALNSTPIKSRPNISQQQTISRFPKSRIDRPNPETTILFGNSRTQTPSGRISPSPKPIDQSLNCNNHPNKPADFQIIIDDEVMYYCEKCSALLASQGFQVVRLIKPNKISSFNTSAQSKKMTNSENGSRFSQITEFCQSARQLLSDYQSNIAFMQGMHSHYLQQQQLIQEFHNGMVQVLHQVKTQHLRMLKSQSRKFLQIADIERAEAEQNANELNDILNDIESNMKDIVHTLSEDRYRQVMNCYEQKMSLFGHQAEEMGRSFEGITCVERRDLEVKLEDFSRLIADFFSAEDLTNNSAKVKNSAQRLIQLAKMTEKKDGKGPFRNLFVDNELQSPIFKKL